VASADKHVDVSPEHEPALLSAITGQPVAVAIQANQQAFQHYKSGIFTPEKCGTAVDHAVLAVGYGTEAGTKYFKVKNSWGAAWGEAGYVRLEQGGSPPKGTCGINVQPTYAVAHKHNTPIPPPTPGPRPPSPTPTPPYGPLPGENSTRCLVFAFTHVQPKAFAHRMSSAFSNTTRQAAVRPLAIAPCPFACCRGCLPRPPWVQGGAAGALGLGLAFFGVTMLKCALFVAGAAMLGWLAVSGHHSPPSRHAGDLHRPFCSLQLYAAAGVGHRATRHPGRRRDGAGQRLPAGLSYGDPSRVF
jgi:hypothetical protein